MSCLWMHAVFIKFFHNPRRIVSICRPHSDRSEQDGLILHLVSIRLMLLGHKSKKCVLPKKVGHGLALDLLSAQKTWMPLVLIIKNSSRNLGGLQLLFVHSVRSSWFFIFYFIFKRALQERKVYRGRCDTNSVPLTLVFVFKCHVSYLSEDWHNLWVLKGDPLTLGCESVYLRRGCARAYPQTCILFL